MSGGAVWLLAGLLLAAQELLAPGYFLLPLGTAAMGAGLLTAAFSLGWEWQVAAFTVLAVALVAGVARRRRPVPDTVNAPAAGLVGATCYAVGFTAGEGRVRFRDGTWQARLASGPEPIADEPMRVLGLDGTTLLVARLTASASSNPAAPAR